MTASAAMCLTSRPRAATFAAQPTTLPVYTDGTARINALLAASLSVAIPAGVYLITGELNVRNGQVIQPETGAQVVLKSDPSYAGRIITTYDKSFTLRGLTFDGAYADRAAQEGSTNVSLLQIVGGTNVTLENNQFQYAPSFALWTWRSTTIQVRGNTFLECWQPIRIDASNLDSGVIENNTFTNTAAYKSIQHIDAINTVNLAVRGNTMQGAGLAEPTSHGYEGTWGNSIYIANSTGHLVELNKVYVNHWSAVVSGSGASRGVIRNNYLSEGTNSTAALWIEQPGAEYITVDGNQIDGGISIGDTGGDHLTITNNTITSRSVGVDVNSGAKTVLIQGNTISSKAGSRHENGIYLWDKSTPDVNVRVLDNRIRGFDKGVAINNPGGVGTVYGLDVRGNSVSDTNVKTWIAAAIKLDRRSVSAER